MKWYLHPHGLEFSKWHPQAIARHIGNISLPQGEPNGALIGGNWRILPLEDLPPILGEADFINSRAVSVVDEGTSAYVTYEIGERPIEEVSAERLSKASDECRKRILAVVDETAQANMTAYAAADQFTQAQLQTYKDGLQWITQMRGTWRGLAEDRRKNIEGDQNWPSPPPDLIELAAQF